jgi:hypothetical protein
MTIPARVHFCWIGPRLPWAYVFAILSAAERSQMQEVVLHHTDLLEDGPQLRALQVCSGVRLAPADPLDCLTQASNRLGLGNRLAELYQRLLSPVMRSDVLRVAILYLHGGIYLDLDTITTATLRPLLESRQFIGSEFILWPRFVLQSRSPLLWARVLTLDGLRKLLRVWPQGWKLFRRIEQFYFRGVNNAVMGAEASAPLLAAYLQAMVELPPERLSQPYALGPELLQEIVDHGQLSDLTVLAPRVFFPLGPEISEHWFRSTTAVQLDAALSPETRVVHWYASVRGKSRVAQISPDYVAAHRATQLYAALVYANIRRLPAS